MVLDGVILVVQPDPDNLAWRHGGPQSDGLPLVTSARTLRCRIGYSLQLVDYLTIQLAESDRSSSLIASNRTIRIAAS